MVTQDYLVEALTQTGHVLADQTLCPDNLFHHPLQVSGLVTDEARWCSSTAAPFNEQEPGARGGRRAVRAHGAGLWRDNFQILFAGDKGSAMQSRALRLRQSPP